MSCWPSCWPSCCKAWRFVCFLVFLFLSALCFSAQIVRDGSFLFDEVFHGLRPVFVFSIAVMFLLLSLIPSERLCCASVSSPIESPELSPRPRAAADPVFPAIRTLNN